MQHLTTLVTDKAAQGAKDVLKKLHEVDAAVAAKDTQGSIGFVYEIWVGDHEDMGLLALCVESYVLGRKAGYDLGLQMARQDPDFDNQTEEQWHNINADVDHHEASPWH